MGALDELIARASAGGGGGSSALDDLIAQASQPDAAPQPEQPRGRVIEMPVQKIAGDDPWYVRAKEAWQAGEPTFTPEQATQQAARQYSAGMQNLAAPGGMLLNGLRHITAPFAAAPQSIPGQVAFAGAQGALEGLAADPDRNPRSMLQGVPAAIGAAGFGLLSRGIGGLAAAPNAAADTNRVRSIGIPAGEVEAMGPLERAELAGAIESNGLHEGGFMPANYQRYARNAGALAAQGSANMAAGEDAIARMPQPPNVAVGPLIARQRAEAERLRGLADTPGNAPQASFRDTLANNLEADTITPGRGPQAQIEPSGWNGHQFAQPGQTIDLPTNQLPWPRALEQRRNLDANTKWGFTSPAEGASNDIRSQFANDLRGGIDEALSAPGVPPEAAQQWRTGRDQYALGARVSKPALAAMNAQGTGNIPTSMTQAATQAASSLTRGRGASFMAGVQRNVGDAITGVSEVPDMAARTSGMQSWLQQKGVHVDNIVEQGRGNQLGTSAIELLHTDPGALGQYQQQFQEAADQGPAAVNALITRLEEDQQFRTGPMRRLQQMTGGQ